MRLQRVNEAWVEVLKQVAFKKFRAMADDIEPEDPYFVTKMRREELVWKHADPWLFKLLFSER